MLKNNEHKLVVIKYGGNAMLDQEITGDILKEIVDLSKDGFQIVVVHGGGPFIKENLKLAGIKSEFIGGHRKTDSKAMKYIEMSLKGEVNSSLVREINLRGAKAVGLSGKDGQIAFANKRYHISETNEQIDLGQVGDVSEIDTSLIYLLLDNGYIPVIASVATGKDGTDYNINADIFAGHLAGALKAYEFIMLTDVDGLMMNPEEKSSLIKELKTVEITKLEGSVIKGGMIPKIEACKTAVDTGAKRSVIINGTKPELIKPVVKDENIFGTIITK